MFMGRVCITNNIYEQAAQTILWPQHCRLYSRMVNNERIQKFVEVF